MSGRTLRDAIELVSIAAGKEGFKHYDGGGAIWAGSHGGYPDATFKDWGLAESAAVILTAVSRGELVPRKIAIPCRIRQIGAKRAGDMST